MFSFGLATPELSIGKADQGQPPMEHPMSRLVFPFSWKGVPVTLADTVRAQTMTEFGFNYIMDQRQLCSCQKDIPSHETFESSRVSTNHHSQLIPTCSSGLHPSSCTPTPARNGSWAWYAHKGALLGEPGMREREVCVCD